MAAKPIHALLAFNVMYFDKTQPLKITSVV